MVLKSVLALFLHTFVLAGLHHVPRNAPPLLETPEFAPIPWDFVPYGDNSNSVCRFLLTTYLDLNPGWCVGLSTHGELTHTVHSIYSAVCTEEENDFCHGRFFCNVTKGYRGCPQIWLQNGLSRLFFLKCKPGFIPRLTNGKPGKLYAKVECLTPETYKYKEAKKAFFENRRDLRSSETTTVPQELESLKAGQSQEVIEPNATISQASTEHDRKRLESLSITAYLRSLNFDHNPSGRAMIGSCSPPWSETESSFSCDPDPHH